MYKYVVATYYGHHAIYADSREEAAEIANRDFGQWVTLQRVEQTED